MSDIAIRAERLSKRYRLGTRERYRTLRDAVTDTLKAPFRRLASHAPRPKADETFWALKDVSFEVKQGEVVGIIGRNGAGKSTLLKILSRITEPTEGEVRVHGRIASLLEVGTGFHPELNGRDNIYLNGAILGMKKSEIRQKFDEIVAFAEVEKFIETPVKHYSSGMYVRLAFAVAAHLDPEILIVDEVLSVGDMNFQKKCLGQMRQVAQSGRTILLVSHQLNQIRRLCDTCLWMDGGKIQISGPPSSVVSSYESSMMVQKDRTTSGSPLIDRSAQFTNWQVLEPRSEQQNLLSSYEPLVVRFSVAVQRRVVRGHHGIALFDQNNSLVWAAESNSISLEPGVHYFDHKLGILPIRPGPYFWQVSLYDDQRQLDLWNAIPPLMVETDLRTHSRDEWQGILNLPATLSIHQPG
jgi:lipopolysaccharide transport system ATP-binding protein